MTLGKTMAAAVLTAMPAAGALADTFVPTIFSDHMVVQQKTPLKVFGKDNPGQKVTVVFQDHKAAAVAGKDGKWQLTVPTPPAGGPYELKIAGTSEKVISDVLVGEVWVCSGQSNMQFGLSAAINGAEEVAKADYPQIRLFHVPSVRNLEPQDDVQAAWQVCTPKTAANFSAVGYFFGRDLQEQIKVPIGLIDSSWGGTAAEAWTPREELSTLPGMKDALEATTSGKAEAWKKYGLSMNKWLGELGIQNAGGEKEKAGWAQVGFDDASWKAMELPVYWQNAGLHTNGIVWFRKTIEIPAGADLNASATLELGGVDDFDVTFVNGKQVGETDAGTPSFWSAPRKYAIPAGTLKAGRNVITVRVVDFGGNGGFAGPASAMKLSANGGKPIDLAGEWKYAMEREITIPGDHLRPPEPAGDNMATELYNAMIHPFVGFPVAGAIWYQGETNAGNPLMYEKLLPTMVKAWRDRWGQNFPFLVVQLASFMHDTGKPSDAPGWAIFRDSQRKLVERTPKFGLALAIDIGDPDDIHPKNKQEVGRRLMLQALEIAYHKDVVASGPTLKNAKVEGSKVVLRFDHIGSGLIAKDGKLANNFALQDKNGTWVWANAQIAGDEVIVWSPEIREPAMIRYAWQNTPAASLYNKEKLPAMPFEAKLK